MKRSDQRKYHYLYKITRDDGRFYIGMHSTDVLEDGYFGSGKLISRSIKKHGVERHSKQILEFLPSRYELKAREKDFITDEVRFDPLCMNIAPGGGGGFNDEEHQRKCSLAGNLSPNRDRKKAAVKGEITKRNNGTGGWKNTPRFTGKSCSDEHRRKIGLKNSLSQKGEKNSQYGSCWVTDGVKPFKIKKEQLDEYLSNGYSRGRKMG